MRDKKINEDVNSAYSDEEIEQIAEVCHSVNKIYCESIDDYSQLSWEDAPQWQRDSAIKGVKFHLNSDSTPEQSHDSWSEEKFNNGWIYGEVKDENKKTHPCLVSYKFLPKKQQTKDYLFKAIVDSYK